MDLISAEKLFAERHREWALSEAAREVNGNFPLLRTIRNSTVVSYLHIMEQLDKTRQLHLATSLVRRTFLQSFSGSGLFDLEGADLSEDEKAQFEDYRIALFRYSGKADIQLAGRSDPNDEPTTKLGLSSFAVEKLAPVLGKKLRKDSRYTWRFRTQAGDWNIDTMLEFDYPRCIRMECHHIAMRSDDARLSRSRDHLKINFAANLGVSGTYWDTPFSQHVVPAVESAVLICSHVMRSISPLLDGLSIRD